MDHIECQQKEIIAEFNRRLGSGEVTFATIDVKLDQIFEQTTKTNGRVTKLEEARLTELMCPKFSWAACVALLGSVGMLLGFAVSVWK